MGLNNRKMGVTLSLLVTFILVTSTSCATEEKITGVYSSLSFNVEGGDLLGEEFFLVLTRNGYQATFQISEGGPSELMLVDVAIKENNISFEIKKGIYAGSFVGKIINQKIVGKLRFSDGVENELSLPKVKYSYWQ